MTYHPHNLPIKRIIMDKWQILQEDEDTRETFPVPLLWPSEGHKTYGTVW